MLISGGHRLFADGAARRNCDQGSVSNTFWSSGAFAFYQAGLNDVARLVRFVAVQKFHNQVGGNTDVAIKTHIHYREGRHRILREDRVADAHQRDVARYIDPEVTQPVKNSHGELIVATNNGGGRLMCCKVVFNCLPCHAGSGLVRFCINAQWS